MKRPNLPSKALVVLATTLLLIAMGADAYAEATRFRPGSTCVPAYGQEDYVSYVVNWSEIRNDSTTNSLTVICPLAEETFPATSTVFVSPYVYDGNVDADPTCTLTAVDWTVFPPAVTPAAAPSWTGSNPGRRWTLGWSISVANPRHLYMTCVLPPQDTSGEPGTGRSYLTSIWTSDTAILQSAGNVVAGAAFVAQNNNEERLYANAADGRAENDSTYLSLDVAYGPPFPLDGGQTGTFFMDTTVRKGTCAGSLTCSTARLDWAMPTSGAWTSSSTSSGGPVTQTLFLSLPIGADRYTFASECTLPATGSGCTGAGRSSVGRTTSQSSVTPTGYHQYLPGSTCVPTNGNEDWLSYEVGYGTSRNVSSSTLTMTCPVAHDPDVTGGRQFEVQVYDGHCNDSVACTGFAVDVGIPTSLAMASSATVKSTRNRTVLALNVSTSDDSAVYHARCNLPPVEPSGSCAGGTTGYSYIESVHFERP